MRRFGILQHCQLPPAGHLTHGLCAHWTWYAKLTIAVARRRAWRRHFGPPTSLLFPGTSFEHLSTTARNFDYKPRPRRWRYYYLLHGLHNASPLSIPMSTSSRKKLWPVQGTPSGTSSGNWVLAAPTTTRVCMSPIVIAVTRPFFTTSIHVVSSNLLSYHLPASLYSFVGWFQSVLIVGGWT